MKKIFETKTILNFINKIMGLKSLQLFFFFKIDNKFWQSSE